MRRRLIIWRVITVFVFSFFSLIISVSIAHSSEIPFQVIKGSIKEGGTFSQSLSDKKISIRWIRLIVSKLEPLMNFRAIEGGTFQFIADEKGELVKFIYEGSPTEIYEIEKTFEGEYLAQKKESPLEKYLVKVEGEIHCSLSRAVHKAGEGNGLVLAIAEVLAWQIDFSRDVRRGDQFKVLVEKLYQGDQFIDYGKIRAVEYRSGKKMIRGILYKGRYYDEKGDSLEKAFLKKPLRYNYISSGFNQKRKHPIMGGVEPHLGIDYAAPIGTPVWAVAHGIVVFRGWVEGYGKQVIIRHPNGYTSYYGHLSRFGTGIKERKHVEQKQVIGYVGSTGLSTGPHLDFRMSKNGKFINPLKQVFPAGKPVGENDKEAFEKIRDEMLTRLNA
jgi:murein DD-endopeptidase MepM/ murein hydrolase activator NlpD